MHAIHHLMTILSGFFACPPKSQKTYQILSLPETQCCSNKTHSKIQAYILQHQMGVWINSHITATSWSLWYFQSGTLISLHNICFVYSMHVHNGQKQTLQDLMTWAIVAKWLYCPINEWAFSPQTSPDGSHPHQEAKAENCLLPPLSCLQQCSTAMRFLDLPLSFSGRLDWHQSASLC